LPKLVRVAGLPTNPDSVNCRPNSRKKRQPEPLDTCPNRLTPGNPAGLFTVKLDEKKFFLFKTKMRFSYVKLRRKRQSYKKIKIAPNFLTVFNFDYITVLLKLRHGGMERGQSMSPAQMGNGFVTTVLKPVIYDLMKLQEILDFLWTRFMS
jgi:hypothetical protein